MKRKIIQIAILDDHPSVIDGLISLLQSQPHFNVSITAATPGDLLCKMTEIHIDMLLVDESILYANEVEFTKRFKELFPYLKIVAIVVTGQHEIMNRMMMEGKISGFLLKNSDQPTLVTALEKISDNTYFREKVLQKMPKVRIPKKESKSMHLTERELEVLRLIEQEYSNKEIARTLFISERTVETHRKNIFRKTKTNSIIGLIKYAYEHKLV
jgi:DNA-binding NarL/FixJ family response regulator